MTTNHGMDLDALERLYEAAELGTFGSSPVSATLSTLPSSGNGDVSDMRSRLLMALLHQGPALLQEARDARARIAQLEQVREAADALRVAHDDDSRYFALADLRAALAAAGDDR